MLFICSTALFFSLHEMFDYYCDHLNTNSVPFMSCLFFLVYPIDEKRDNGLISTLSTTCINMILSFIDDRFSEWNHNRGDSRLDALSKDKEWISTGT